MLFEAQGLTVCYDTAMVLTGTNLGVNTGELVGLVGPNGAGKSTVLRCIAGLIKWEKDTQKGTRYGDIRIEGIIIFDGERIDKLPAHEIARKGLTICPERGRPFSELTVTENLKIGAHLLNSTKKVHANLDRVYDLFPVLKDRGGQIAGTLSGGERQMLAIGRALMADPKLLCIDEPTIGLSPKLRENLFDRIRQIYQLGIAVLLVEQDVSFAFGLSSRNYVLSRGKIIAEGTAEELLRDETIRETYLGL